MVEKKKFNKKIKKDKGSRLFFNKRSRDKKLTIAEKELAAKKARTTNTLEARTLAEQRRVIVAKLIPRGFTLREMAKILAKQGFVHVDGTAFTYQTVRKDVVLLNKRFLEEASESVETHKARLLHELEEIKRTAWSSAGDKDKDKDKFLKVILEAIKEQNKILGLHAPEQHEVKHASVVFNYHSVSTREDVEKLKAIQTKSIEGKIKESTIIEAEEEC